MEFPSASPPGPLAPHKIAAQQQATRNHIRQQITLLPAAEAAMFRSFLNRTEAAIKMKKKKEATEIFPFDKLSGEIQNMILRELLVTPQLIKPSVIRSRYGRREWHKYDLGASILNVNKTMHEAALPILLGENTFVLNNDFNYVLGKGTKRSNLRGALVRKIIVPSKLKPRMRLNLKKLTNLTEVTIVDHEEASLSQNDMKDQWESKARARFTHVDGALKTKIAESPSTTFNFVSGGTVSLLPTGPSFTYTWRAAAFRWEVKKDESVSESFFLNLVRKNEYNGHYRHGYPEV